MIGTSIWDNMLITVIAERQHTHHTPTFHIEVVKSISSLKKTPTPIPPLTTS